MNPPDYLKLLPCPHCGKVDTLDFDEQYERTDGVVLVSAPWCATPRRMALGDAGPHLATPRAGSWRRRSGTIAPLGGQNPVRGESPRSSHVHSVEEEHQ